MKEELKKGYATIPIDRYNELIELETRIEQGLIKAVQRIKPVLLINPGQHKEENTRIIYLSENEALTRAKQIFEEEKALFRISFKQKDREIEMWRTQVDAFRQSIIDASKNIKEFKNRKEQSDHIAKPGVKSFLKNLFTQTNKS
jgi:hypothetical protein